MAKRGNPFSDAIRKREKKKKSRKKDTTEEMEEWRVYWREAGPVRFAEEVLTCPPDVPEHPALGRVPEKIILSDDQKEFLWDIWKGGITKFIMAAGRGCLEENTPIQLQDGRIEKIKDINPGERILSYDYKTNQIIEGIVSRTIYNGMKEVCELSSSRRNKVELTLDHPILQKYYNKTRWLKAEEFVPYKDRRSRRTALVLDSYDVPDYDISDNKLKLLSALISEGYYGQGQTPKITNTDMEYLKEMELCVKEEFGIESKYYQKGDGYDLVLTSYTKERSELTQKEYMKEYHKRYKKHGRKHIRSPIIEWLRELKIYGQTKEHKEIPEFLFRCSNRQLHIFFGVFFRGDGNINIRTKKTVTSYNITLYPGLSSKLEYQLRTLLSRLGIYPTRNIRNRGQKDSYETRFYREENYKRFFNKMSLRSGYVENTNARIKRTGERKRVYDLEMRGVNDNFIANGYVVHNCGKTFILAIYACWRLCCFDAFSITIMGGSQEQSEIIKMYIDGWRDDIPEIFYCLHLSRGGGSKTAVIYSRWKAYGRFPACSDSAARGPHVTQVVVDEMCVGEAKSKGGAKAVRSIRGQLAASPNHLLGFTSTAQNILGTFYNTWRNAIKQGYKRYRWSTVRHISSKWFMADGKTIDWKYVDDILADDRKPSNWMPNVWWITQELINDGRPDMTKDEWIVEWMGGITRGSGLIFSRDDLAACICDGRKWTSDLEPCIECEPYTDKCPMMEKLEGLTMSMISERIAGVDFGGKDPHALTVLGRRGGVVFVLFSDERTGIGDEEAIKWMDDTIKSHGVWTVFADPEARAMRNALDARGYETPNIWAGAGGTNLKKEYLVNVKRHIEKHIMIIPVAFDYLCNSITDLSYDNTGRIRKHNDHSFDSMMYAMVDYDIDDYGGGFYSEIKERIVPTVW